MCRSSSSIYIFIKKNKMVLFVCVMIFELIYSRTFTDIYFFYYFFIDFFLFICLAL